MSRIRPKIVGMVLAGFLAGCGGDVVDEGPGGFKPTDVKPLEPLVKEMQDMMKKGDYAKKAVPPPEKKEAEKEKEKKSK